MVFPRLPTFSPAHIQLHIHAAGLGIGRLEGALVLVLQQPALATIVCQEVQCSVAQELLGSGLIDSESCKMDAP